jgi:hypothetical protein
MVNTTNRALRCFWRMSFSMGTGLLATGFTISTQAGGYQSLSIVRPAISCEQLAHSDLSMISDAKIVVNSALVRETDKGPYCRVTATAEPNISFAADLPIERWTQRFVLGAQGREGIVRAGGCMPALNGEIAVATTMQTGANSGYTPGDPWGVPPQARINNAYLAQHMTAVAVKDIIKVFYGNAAKFSYMVGCSGGGAQTLTEAQRFPEDFDGYSIGAPPIYDTVHNLGFWHGWEYHVNQRADGSIILTKDRLGILHDAAIAHCSAVAGTIDGGLQQPTACTFDKAWVQCTGSAAGTSKCLTSEEASVAEQLYLGPNDGKHFFEISGFPLGSELLWRMSSRGKPADNEALNPNKIHSVLMPPESGETTEALMAKFTFTQDWWDKTNEMQPLFNIANTNLHRLAQRGSKIILWTGAEDSVVQPAVAISYYEGVQKEMGMKQTDTFMRLFLLPGVGHCGNGDGANQVDILSPLMAWVELHQDPKVIVAGRPASAASPGGGGPQTLPGAPPAYPPYAEADLATEYTRPVFPFPNVARYTGKGDPNDRANYKAVKGPLKVPQSFPNETAKLIGPNNQKFYHAEDGNLMADPKREPGSLTGIN